MARDRSSILRNPYPGESDRDGAQNPRPLSLTSNVACGHAIVIQFRPGLRDHAKWRCARLPDPVVRTRSFALLKRIDKDDAPILIHHNDPITKQREEFSESDILVPKYEPDIGRYQDEGHERDRE